MDMFSLEQLANFAEIFGVIAVVGSLAYVGIQLRQSVQAMKVAAAQAHLDGYQNCVGNFVRAPQLAGIWYRGIRGVSELRDEEIVQFFAQMGLVLHFSESAYLQWRAGALAEEQWEGLVGLTADVMQHKGSQEFFEYRSHWFSEEFRTWVKDEMPVLEAKIMYPDADPSEATT